MTPTKRSLLATILVLILCTPVFSQPVQGTLSSYKKGELLAIKDPEKAYLFFVEAMYTSKRDKDWPMYLKSVNTLAALAFKSTEDQRREVFKWAIEAIEVLNNAKKDSALAELHYNVAEFYNADYEIELPIYHYESAKEIWISLKGELDSQVAKCYHGLGDVYKYNKFDFHEAEKCYEKALLIREKIQFHDNHVLYQNYYSLAATNRSQHDFEKALSYGSKTLAPAQQLNNMKAVEMCYGMVANIHRDMGESAAAKKYYLDAISK